MWNIFKGLSNEERTVICWGRSHYSSLVYLKTITAPGAVFDGAFLTSAVLEVRNFLPGAVLEARIFLPGAV